MNNRFFVVLLCLIFPSIAFSNQSPTWFKDATVCATLSEARAQQICTRIVESRKLLNDVRPTLVQNKKGRAVAREAVLVAWDVKNTPHLINLTLPLRVSTKVDYQPTVQSPGYTVTRTRGTGPYKLEFRVTNGETELKVYGGKYVWLPKSAGQTDSYHILSRFAETREYLPFQDHLFHPEIVRHGKSYLQSVVESARAELRNVPSQAFPGWTLFDLYPSEMIINLIVSEQTDPFKLFDERVEVGLPRSAYLLGVLIEIAIHGPRAFAELCSGAAACGWTQFTNRRVKHFPGTYTYTHQSCKTARGQDVILQDFTQGTRDPINAIKAAICYLDLENAALPKEARAEFLKDPRHGSIYMLTAYNAGGGWSQRVFRNVRQLRHTGGLAQRGFDHESLPRVLFERGNFYNNETHWYIRKYLWLWELLFAGQETLIPANAPTHPHR